MGKGGREVDVALCVMLLVKKLRAVFDGLSNEGWESPAPEGTIKGRRFLTRHCVYSKIRLLGIKRHTVKATTNSLKHAETHVAWVPQKL